ncbi:vacuolar protein sorting/targeting protein PEP1 [Physocladia obscura]|uniref:Vacuolar protein sorting/targeting protein PEP1 n=1 Tax=Physocladia obscura TaxID=109957 RepID=A0AAD5X720_9FUNG|nr:vacuolar protein sorting/targeting protein PEP1 [Physocladia obscura]
MFSTEGAIGFMMGVGNVGSYLKERNDGNTFLTRDAGLTWIEVAKDAHQFEFGDNGGIILLANDEEPTDIVKYSLNYGNTFQEVTISSQLDGGKLRVNNIISEPYGSSYSFVIFGIIYGGTKDAEVAAIHLDFEKVWSRLCQLIKDDPSQSDFEVWSPTGEMTGDEHCMLGQQVQYYRRKADRECHSKGIYEAPVTLVKACQCTTEDFTCDVGYIRNSSNACAINPGYDAMPTCKNGQLKYSSGYVKVKGTKCVGGLTLDAGKVESCATSISFGGWVGIFAVVLGISFGVSYTVVRMKRGGRIRLPVDDDVLASTMNNTRNWTERSGKLLRNSMILLMGVVEIGLAKVGDVYDWVRNGYYRSIAGYMAVQDQYTDVDLEPDSSLLFEDE